MKYFNPKLALNSVLESPLSLIDLSMLTLVWSPAWLVGNFPVKRHKMYDYTF